jgi:hypothetical protein
MTDVGVPHVIRADSGVPHSLRNATASAWVVVGEWSLCLARGYPKVPVTADDLAFVRVLAEAQMQVMVVVVAVMMMMMM